MQKNKSGILSHLRQSKNPCNNDEYKVWNAKRNELIQKIIFSPNLNNIIQMDIQPLFNIKTKLETEYNINVKKYMALQLKKIRTSGIIWQLKIFNCRYECK